MALDRPKFTIYEDIDGGWRWNLKSRNGEIIAQGESYTTEAGAKRGVAAVKRNSVFAKTEVVVEN